MSCQRCGMPAQGGLCQECELAEGVERRHGVPSDDFDGWAIVQEGLGDAEMSGQTTLDGGIQPDGGER